MKWWKFKQALNLSFIFSACYYMFYFAENTL
jgi:hypothetical protein